MIPEDRQRASEIVKAMQEQLGHGSRKIIAELFNTTPIYISFARNLTKTPYHTQGYACPQEVINQILSATLKMELS